MSLGLGPAAPRPVRIGVLGTADIARRRMLPAFAACPLTEVAAVASRDDDRAVAQTERFGGRPVHGYAALLERDDIDAVYVPLPIALHAEWVERALLAGRHVLAEKPLTASPARTRRLLALARARGLVLMENVMFVRHPQHEAVRRLVAEGAIGAPRSFSAAFTIPELPPHDIRFSAELGGGALLDIGLYPVRAALHLLGGDLTVAGAVLHRPPDREVETSGAVLLRRPDGVTAQLTFGIGAGYRSMYEICGATGRLRVDRAFTPPADHRPALVLERAGGSETVGLEAADQVEATVRAFAEAVRGVPGAAPDHRATLRQSLLLAAVRRAASGPAPGFESPSSRPADDGPGRRGTAQRGREDVRVHVRRAGRP
ncbi:Predicted dehydrogenase [Streptomyces misionensis]|uniref:Predicted dehydrogenase n=1 Tax=Streptomyces misionensis TaxID=67331 RepID=A0A1H4IAZ4_9ACTN|nr:Gfo/Idh/MocA family oxidoreductase [Streptomyces misionensis]SEB31085.1 Predicted dehydrogenase [Streptomyces misionensis]